MTTALPFACVRGGGGLAVILAARLAVRLLALAGLAAAAGAAPPEAGDPYLQTVWTTEEGLPQNSVNAIVQTRDGYLWLGTFGGLTRFDGVKFTIFNTGNTPGLKSNRILSLCEGRGGVLWIGTESGEVMSFKDGVGKTYTTGDGLPGGYVWTTFEDRAGTLWVGTSIGAARFEGGRFVTVELSGHAPGDQVWSISEDPAGRLWITTNSGLGQFDGGKFVTLQPPGGVPENLFVPFFACPAGGGWIGTKHGLARFSDGNFTPKAAGDPSWQARALMEDREGTLWISYYNPSLLGRLKDGAFVPYRLKSGSEVVRAMYQDREGNLWMGSDGGGLVRLKPRRVVTYTAEDGLPSDSVRAITGDGADGMWISATLGLSHWRAGKFTNYTPRDGLLSPYVAALCRDSAGRLWIGSNYGLTRLADGRFSNYTPAQGLSNPNVSALAEGPDGALWVGTLSGLNRLRDGKFAVWRRSDGLASDDIRFILPSGAGALWLGTVGGLSRFENGTFTNYTTRQGLSNDYVRAVVEEPDGGLWLGTYGGGLNYFRDGRFTQITTQHGLFDDFISRILEDGRGNFWFLGNRGVFKVSRRELLDFVGARARTITSVSYGIADGMKSSEGNGGTQPAGWRAADGRLWFPTIKGVVVMDPGPGNELPAPVHIEQVLLDREALPAGQPVRVGPRQGSLEIQYTGVGLSRPEQIKFRFQLLGLDADWVDAGTRRTAYYSPLPPGAYTFRVVADNGDGVWSTPGASLPIVVAPPFYRTWWFLSLALAGVAGAAFLWHHRRLTRLREANAAQVEFSRRLMESQEGERRRIAAELHDSLGQSLAIIKNRALLSLSRPDDHGQALEQLQEISEASTQVIDEVKVIAHNLRPYQLDRLGLTRTIEGMLRRVGEIYGLRFTVELDRIDGLFPPEAETGIFRIVQESVNNIVKHSGAAAATVRIRKQARRVEITVEDNGRGFDADAVRGNPQRGFGLVGTAERARVLGGSYAVVSSPGRGTTVTVTLGLKGGSDEA